MVNGGASLSKLCIGKLIQPDVGVPLSSAGLLYDQRHQPGEGGRPGGGAADFFEDTLRLYQVPIVTRRAEGDIGNAAIAAGKDSRCHLPGGLGVIQRDAAA